MAAYFSSDRVGKSDLVPCDLDVRDLQIHEICMFAFLTYICRYSSNDDDHSMIYTSAQIKSFMSVQIEASKFNLVGD